MTFDYTAIAEAVVIVFSNPQKATREKDPGIAEGHFVSYGCGGFGGSLRAPISYSYAQRGKAAGDVLHHCTATRGVT